MVFLGLRYPTPASRRVATDHGTKRGFNYPPEHVGASRHSPPPPSSSRKEAAVPSGKAPADSQSRFQLNVPYVADNTSTRVGGGAEDFAAAKRAVSTWKHFQLGWSEVAPGTGATRGDPVCVCARVLGVWIRNPLQVVYKEETADRFALAHGCLQGHMLAGEEAFVVEKKSDGTVWFAVNTFSRPAHPLATLSYPAVRLLQWRFARDATKAVQREVRSARDGKTKG